MNGATPSPLLLLLRVNLVQAFRKLRAAGSRSRFLTCMIGLFILSYPIIASGLFHLGLRRLSATPGIGEVLIKELVFLLFAFLFFLLLFSNVVVGFSNLFRNREAQHLLTLPLSSDSIFRWKFIESTIIASWAFLLLVAPLLVAYGIHQPRASWHFYLLTPVLISLFILLPAIIGCWLAIVMARHLDRRRLIILAFPSFITVVLGIYIYMQPEVVADESLITYASEERSRLLGKAQFAQWPFMPSYWLSKSVVEWKDGVFSLSVFYMMVMLSNVLFFGCLAFTRSGRFFYSAMSATLSRGNYLSDWRGHLRYAGIACTVLLTLSFFLPYLSTTGAMQHANAQMHTLRLDADNHDDKAFWPASATNRQSPDSGELRKRLDSILDDLGGQLGHSRLGSLSVTSGQLDEARPDFLAMPKLVAEQRGSVDMESLEAEFSLRLNQHFRQHLSGLDLALGYNPKQNPNALANAPPLGIGALLFAVPLLGAIAGFAKKPVLFVYAGILPFALLAVVTLPAGFPPLQYIGIGGWLAFISCLGLLAAALGWWDRIEPTENTNSISMLERIIRCIPGIAPDTRALLLKDTRVFWRDTAQWSQSLILFGILGVYIMNIRYFTQQFTSTYWLYVVSYMNLAACALNLATLTTRFVYPQFSLEGKRLWIVGLAPMGLARVVRIKLVLAIVISLLISLPLVWLSCHMLGLRLEETLYFTLGIICMAVTLNCLAIGMGVLYPNLKVDNPSKIVSGFGGTFCLVVSFVYIGGSVMFLGQASPWGSPWHLFGKPSVGAMALAGTSFLALSFVLGAMPVILARDKLNKFEQ